MEKLIILNRGYPTQTYTFNTLFKEIATDDGMQDFLINCYKSKDCIKLGEYLDIYCNYLYDIIDESDFFYLFTTDKNLYNNCLNNLQYKVYCNWNQLDIEIFDIKDKKDKMWLKEHLTFNISDEDGFPLSFNLRRSYLANDEKMDEFNEFYFIKDNKFVTYFSRYNGYLFDFRDNDVIEKHKEKYRKKK